MSENYQENSPLPEQDLPGEHSADPGFMHNAGEDKITQPPIRNGLADALSDEKAVADHNDLHQSKSDALLGNTHKGADATAEAAAHPQRTEPAPLPETAIAVPTPEVPQQTPSQPQQLTVTPPTTVVQPEAEVVVAPSPRPRPLWVIPVAILATLALCFGTITLYRNSRPQSDYTLAEKVLPTEIPTEAPTEATTAPTLPRAELATYDYIRVASKPWEGEVSGKPMDFTCDMDGDGTPEYYRFCIRMTNMPYVKDQYYDICDTGFQSSPERILHAYVWRLLPDGTTEPASEFAEHLTDVSLTIYRVDDLESYNPSFQGSPNIWPGYAIVTFTPKRSGTWLYEMKAMFGDLELTATYTSTFHYR